MQPTSAPSPGATVSNPPAPPKPPGFPFSIFLSIFFLALLVTTVITAVLPESYASSARILVQRDQADISGLGDHGGGASYDPYFSETQARLICSSAVLEKAVETLDLNKKLAERSGLSQPLKTSESIEILKRKLRVVPVRNTDIIQIEAVDTNPEEAATLANAVVAAYRDYRSQIRARKIADALPVLQRAYDENRREILELQTEIAGLSRAQNAADTNRIADANKRLEERQQLSVSLLFKRLWHQTDLALPATDMVRIIDPAIPPSHPENPNFRLNLTVAFLVGGFAGLFLAATVYLLQRRGYRRQYQLAHNPFPPPVRAVAHSLVALVAGFIIGYHCATPTTLFTVILIPLTILLAFFAALYIELADRPVPASPPSKP